LSGWDVQRAGYKATRQQLQGSNVHACLLKGGRIVVAGFQYVVARFG
jgi:hypothetical protein